MIASKSAKTNDVLQTMSGIKIIMSQISVRFSGRLSCAFKRAKFNVQLPIKVFVAVKAKAQFITPHQVAR